MIGRFTLLSFVIIGTKIQETLHEFFFSLFTIIWGILGKGVGLVAFYILAYCFLAFLFVCLLAGSPGALPSGKSLGWTRVIDEVVEGCKVRGDYRRGVSLGGLCVLGGAGYTCLVVCS